MRDKAKQEVVDTVASGVRHVAAGLRHRLANHGVVDVEVGKLSELEIQVKLVFQSLPPRYFVVSVREKF